MTQRRSFALIALFLLSACDRAETVPLTGEAVRASVRENARLHARSGAHLIADFIEGGFADLAYARLCEVTAEDPEVSCSAPELDFEASDADEIVEELVEKYLSDDRVVSETPNEVVFAIDPVEICGMDAECRANVMALDLRLIAREPAPGAIEVRLTSDTFVMFVLELDEDRVSLEADLAGIRAVVARHAGVFEVDPAELPEVMGRVRAALERPSERRFLGELAITEDIQLQHTSDEGTYELTIGASTLLTIDANAETESLVATIALDRVDATFPAGLLDRFFEIPVRGVAHFELGGLTASANLANLENRLEITGLGLGQTTTALSLDGVSIASVDLNAAFGRELTLAIEAIDDQFELSFDSALAIEAATFLMPLADQGHDIPSWLLGSTSSLAFTANGSAPAMTIARDSARVDHGTLTFSSSALSASITVDAGMCVAIDDGIDVHETHPFAAISANVCE